MLVIVTGVSCIGKSSIMMHLKRHHSCNILPVYMTRNRRENETEKTTVSHKEFYEMQAAGQFIYVNEVFGNLYGTPKSESLHASTSNKIWLIDFPVNLVDTAFSSLNYKTLALVPETENQLKLQIQLAERQERQEAILSDYMKNYAENLSSKVDEIVINRFCKIEATIEDILFIFNKWGKA